jgi:hypothetical protein
MLAAILSTPELQLGDEAGRQYAEAVVAYARHHDIAAQAKTVDLVNLLMVASGHYGMAFMAARLRRRADAAQAVEAQPNGYDPAEWTGASAQGQA